MASYKPVLGDQLEMRIYCYTPSQISVNTIHYYVPTVPVTFGATVLEIAFVLNAIIAPLFKGLIASTARYRGLSLQKINAPARVPEVAKTLDGPGTGSSGLTPTQVCGIVHFKTSLAGPANRGRLYLPFVDLSDVTSAGAPGAAYITAINTLFTALGTSDTIVGAGGSTRIDMTIRHKANPLVNTPVESIEPGTKFATQRKRGMYGRTNATPLP